MTVQKEYRPYLWLAQANRMYLQAKLNVGYGLTHCEETLKLYEKAGIYFRRRYGQNCIRLQEVYQGIVLCCLHLGDKHNGIYYLRRLSSARMVLL